MQKNLKLVSCRIDPDTLAEIDRFVARHTYWTKNAVINNVLIAVFSRFNERDIYDMVRSNNFVKEPTTAIYRIGTSGSNLKDSDRQ